jgi:hypothetical protein
MRPEQSASLRAPPISFPTHPAGSKTGLSLCAAVDPFERFRQTGRPRKCWSRPPLVSNRCRRPSGSLNFLCAETHQHYPYHFARFSASHPKAQRRFETTEPWVSGCEELARLCAKSDDTCRRGPYPCTTWPYQGRSIGSSIKWLAAGQR